MFYYFILFLVFFFRKYIILSFDKNVLLFGFVYYYTYMFVYVKLYLDRKSVV